MQANKVVRKNYFNTTHTLPVSKTRERFESHINTTFLQLMLEGNQLPKHSRAMTLRDSINNILMFSPLHIKRVLQAIRKGKCIFFISFVGVLNVYTVNVFPSITLKIFKIHFNITAWTIENNKTVLYTIRNLY